MRYRSLMLTAALVFAMAADARASVVLEEDEVVFRLSAVEAQRVYLAGDFNGWNPTVDLMTSREGSFEIRLYLLPGSYRYRFVADGASMSDPDNPCRDPDGNSCFTLLDRGEGALEIRLVERVEAAAPAGGREIVPSFSVFPFARRRAVGFGSRADLRGTVGEAMLFEGSGGLDAGSFDGGDLAGASFLIAGRAEYRFGENALRVFVRPDSLVAGPGSLAPVFGTVGPYRYPAGLFCRGASIDARLPFRLDGRILYASRIRGYRSGLEAATAPGDTASRRLLLDADALAASIGGRILGTDAAFVYRFDRRAREDLSSGPGAGTVEPSSLHDEVRIRGLFLSRRLGRNVLLESAALFGKVDRVAEGSAAGVGKTVDRGRESGYRLGLALSRHGDRGVGRLSWVRTTIETGPGRGELSRDSFGGALAVSRADLRAEAAVAVDIYAGGGDGARFRLATSSFWLDGDEVDLGLVPLLSEDRLYEAKVAVEWRRELFAGLPWGTGLAVQALRRASTAADGPSSGEARFSSGVPLRERLTLIVDMRGAFYRYGPARRDFVDAFMGLHARITDRHWVLVGCGVAPWDFDPWHYRYTGFGRERYLEERRAFETYAARGESAAAIRLFDAEESLAEEWNVTLQAGFTF